MGNQLDKPPSGPDDPTFMKQRSCGGPTMPEIQIYLKKQQEADALAAEVEKVKRELSEKTDGLIALGDDKAKLQADIITLQEQLDAANMELLNIPRLQAALDAEQLRVTELEAAKQTGEKELREQVAQQKEAIAAIEVQLSDRVAALQAANTKIEEQETHLHQREEHRKQLDEELQKKQAEGADVGAQLRSLSEQYSESLTSIDELKAAKAELEAKLAKQESDNDELRQKYAQKMMQKMVLAFRNSKQRVLERKKAEEEKQSIEEMKKQQLADMMDVQKRLELDARPFQGSTKVTLAALEELWYVRVVVIGANDLKITRRPGGSYLFVKCELVGKQIEEVDAFRTQNYHDELGQNSNEPMWSESHQFVTHGPPTGALFSVFSDEAAAVPVVEQEKAKEKFADRLLGISDISLKSLFAAANKARRYRSPTQMSSEEIKEAKNVDSAGVFEGVLDLTTKEQGQGRTVGHLAVRVECRKVPQTTLRWDLGWQHQPMAQFLRYASVNTELTDKSGRTTLLNAVRAGNVEMVRALLMAGADIEATDKRGMTPLLTCAKTGAVDMAKMLFRSKPKPNVNAGSGKKNVTPLMFAVAGGFNDFVDILFERGDHLNLEQRDKDGMSALLIACSIGDEALCKLLVARGADVNARNNSGQTALMLCSQLGHPSIMKMLMEKGAKADATDLNGNTAADLARIHKQPMSLAVLAQHSRKDSNISNASNGSHTRSRSRATADTASWGANLASKQS